MIKFLQKIFRPFLVARQIPSLCVLWLIFVVLFGICGIIASFPLYNLDKLNIIHWANIILGAGSLYSIGIALCASQIFVIFSEMLLNALGKLEDDVKFIQLKIVAIAISIMLIVLMAMSYSKLLAMPISANNENIKNIDIIQIIFYFLALFMSFYMFCVSCLKIHYETFQDMDDLRRNELKKDAKKLYDDGSGTKL